MTIIAWDGKVLAADKRSVNGGMINTTTKIYRIGDTLVGFAGNSDVCSAMRNWFESGAKPAEYPEMQKAKETWVECLVIYRDKIQRYEQTPYPLTLEDSFIAIGSGRAYAMAAMFLGKSAFEAVNLASCLDCACGNGVDTLRFE